MARDCRVGTAPGRVAEQLNAIGESRRCAASCAEGASKLCRPVPRAKLRALWLVEPFGLDACQRVDQSAIAGNWRVLPPYRYLTTRVTDSFVSIPDFEGYEDIVRQLHASAKVNSRHPVLNAEKYLRS